MKLNYREFGKGMTVIILHGLLGSLDNWQTLARRFSEFFRVFTLDQRNHGHSPHSAEMSYHLMSNDVLEFIREREISRPVLMGHSMGGKTAMQFAFEHPALIHSLIVVDICPRAYSNQHSNIIDTLGSVEFDSVRNRGDIEKFLMERLKERSVVQFLAKSIYRKEEGKYAFRFNLDSIRNHIDEISDWTEGGPYTGPSLFIRGGKSPYFSDNEPSVIRQFPNSRTVIIPNAGHWVHAEAPNEVFSAVLNFAAENL